MNAYSEIIFVLSLLSCVFSRTFLSGGIGAPIFSAFSRILPRVYLKSRNHRLFLQAQPDFCLTSCLCLRNIRHFLCFQIHLRETLSTPTYSIKRKTPFFDTLHTFICTYFCFYYIIVPAKMKHLTPDEQTYLRFV